MRLQTGEQKPTSFVEMTPQANGVSLKKLNQLGAVEAAYSWRAYKPSKDAPSEGEEGKMFLAQLLWYGYPDKDTYMERFESLRHVAMTFRPDGYAREERVTKLGFDQPDQVELREFKNVDISQNWTTIPEFGEWTAFFEPDRGAGVSR